ncbi:NIPSNAP family protein [Rufibacter latericius]|uniref:NIPSNAP family containing protein n=1 Tax=Rufibacter latericius TaxID=2487040 RepID=A0A3M9M8L2_9BACT|nr:NIPSNAP family protein [Rufibacter latericius]RNI21872.1 NIPSNAP family containing protein [Rufibacter latericius]
MYFQKRKGSFLLLLVAFFSFACAVQVMAAPKREFYQLKIYHLKDQSQEDRLDSFLKNAYLPALHRAGIGKVGVFKPVAGQGANAAAPTEKLVYVFVPFTSSEQIFKVEEGLAKDKQLATTGKDYLEATHDKPVYQRLEVVLMQAFTGKPVFTAPTLKSPTAERVYELRSYEAATEKLHENKIAMFNNGEMEIFQRLGFNPVFYAQVKAGSKMPNLMYMTSFENRESREEKWKAFGADPAWKKMSADSQYANNFLHADIYLLHPTAYSEI